MLDTAYGVWLDVPLARTDTIVALDYARLLSLGRLVRRSLARAHDEQTVCNGNTESWHNLVSRESIIVWHFQNFRRKRDRIRSWTSDPAVPPVVRLTSPGRWLATLGPVTTDPATVLD